MSEYWLDILLQFSIFSTALSLVVVFFYRKRMEYSIAIIVLSLLLLSFLADIVSISLVKLYHLYTCYTHSIYDFLIGIFIFLFYYHILTNKWVKRTVVGLYGIHLSFALHDIYVSYSGIDISPDLAHSYLCAAVCVMALIYLFQKLLEPGFYRIEKDKIFWINSAFILLYGTTLFLWLFNSYINQREGMPPIHQYLWPIQMIATITFNVIMVRTVFIRQTS